MIDTSNIIVGKVFPLVTDQDTKVLKYLGDVIRKCMKSHHELLLGKCLSKYLEVVLCTSYLSQF